MKFKPNAASIALYRMLGLSVVLFYSQGALLLIIVFFIAIFGDIQNQADAAILFLIYLGLGIISLVIGEYLRETRKAMLTKKEDLE